MRLRDSLCLVMMLLFDTIESNCISKICTKCKSILCSHLRLFSLKLLQDIQVVEWLAVKGRLKS